MFSPDCNFPDTADFYESGERSTLSEWTSLLIAWLSHFWEQSVINYTLRVNDENKWTVCSAHFQTCGKRILSAYCRARKWFVGSNSLLISRKVISKSMGAECNIPIFQLVLTGLINAMTTWISRPCTLGWDPDPDSQGWGWGSIHHHHQHNMSAGLPRSCVPLRQGSSPAEAGGGISLPPPV